MQLFAMTGLSCASRHVTTPEKSIKIILIRLQALIASWG